MQNKKNWKKVRLKEIGKIITGKTPPTAEKDYFNGDFPFITPTDIHSFDIRYNYSTERFLSKKWFVKSKNLLIPENSICFVCIGSTIGKICLTKKDSFTNQQINTIIVDMEKVNQLFLFYLLKSNQNHIVKEYGGGGVAKSIINKSTFENIKLNMIEDIDEQKRIADILSAFDDKIELNNKINKILEEMAQGIFKEWFLKSQKSKVKSQKLGELLEIISGYPFSSKFYVNDEKAMGVITIKNVQDGNFITNCDSFIQEKNIPKNINQECLLQDGDILLSLTGNVGRICFVYGGKYLLNQRVAKLKPKNEKDIAFSYFLFRQISIQNRLINMAKGSAQPNLSPIETGKIELEIPPRDILDKFAEILNPIYQKLIKNKKENQKLIVLRDLLLPKLMSGEIRV